MAATSYPNECLYPRPLAMVRRASQTLEEVTDCELGQDVIEDGERAAGHRLSAAIAVAAVGRRAPAEPTWQHGLLATDSILAEPHFSRCLF
jgi:hypothetical protein